MQSHQAINFKSFQVLKPPKVLNKAHLKVKSNRTQIEKFKTNLIKLLDRSNETESEKFHKNVSALRFNGGRNRHSGRFIEKNSEILKNLLWIALGIIGGLNYYSREEYWIIILDLE